MSHNGPTPRRSINTLKSERGHLMPPTRKPASRRQNRVTQDVGIVRVAGKPPRMPSGLCGPARAAWQGYWGDAVSGVMRDSDATLALRWIRNVDRLHRLLAEADRSPIVGPATNPRPNALYRLCFKIEESVRSDEAQLGIGPAARLKLGLIVAAGAASLADLNAAAEADADDEDDFRLRLLMICLMADCGFILESTKPPPRRKRYAGAPRPTPKTLRTTATAFGDSTVERKFPSDKVAMTAGSSGSSPSACRAWRSSTSIPCWTRGLLRTFHANLLPVIKRRTRPLGALTLPRYGHLGELS